MKSYGWIDRKAGLAHIPIERAIEIIARSGIPPSGVTETWRRRALPRTAGATASAQLTASKRSPVIAEEEAMNAASDSLRHFC